jgi:ABC-type glycerol-3-phosphate transport system substrate-binding protein
MSILEAQARGEVWIHFNWPFAMGYLESKRLAPQVDLSASIPAGPDGDSTPLGGGYLAIPQSAPHPALAAAFLQYLLSAEVQRNLSHTMNWYGSVPPPPESKDALLYAGFTAMRPFVRPRAVICDYAELSNLWQRALRGAMFGDEPPRHALEEVAARFDRAHAQSGASGCDQPR